MATREDIKKAILAVAGNPESGIVAEYADRWADAIIDLDNEAASEDAKAVVGSSKETRVIKPSELR